MPLIQHVTILTSSLAISSDLTAIIMFSNGRSWVINLDHNVDWLDDNGLWHETDHGPGPKQGSLQKSRLTLSRNVRTDRSILLHMIYDPFMDESPTWVTFAIKLPKTRCHESIHDNWPINFFLGGGSQYYS